MILLLRAVSGLLSFLALIVLAIVGLAVALFSLGSGPTGLSIPGLAKLITLPHLSGDVNRLLRAVEAPHGSIAGSSLLAGLLALLAGILLLIGLLWPRRERLITLERTDDGAISAKRRPLRQVAAALSEQAAGVTTARVRLRTPRFGGRRSLRVAARHPQTVAGSEVEQEATHALEPLTDAFHLKAHVRASASGPRVR